jgi:hypothetical protein
LERTETIRIKDKNGQKQNVQVIRKFTHHAFRKGFAMNRVEEYLRKFTSQKTIDEYISKRSKENPRVEIGKKLKTLKGRINEDRKEERELNAKEYAIFFYVHGSWSFPYGRHFYVLHHVPGSRSIFF